MKDNTKCRRVCRVTETLVTASGNVNQYNPLGKSLVVYQLPTAVLPINPKFSGSKQQTFTAVGWARSLPQFTVAWASSRDDSQHDNQLFSESAREQEKAPKTELRAFHSLISDLPLLLPYSIVRGKSISSAPPKGRRSFKGVVLAVLLVALAQAAVTKYLQWGRRG